LTTLIVSHDPGIARHVNRVVAIRDGKMATETVRQFVLNGATNGGTATEDGTPEGEQAEEIFEELVVLDSAGRLQVPKEYLEYFEIKGRARLELTEDGILILPAPQSSQAQATEISVSDLAPATERRGLSDLLGLPSLPRVKASISKVRERFSHTRHSDTHPEPSRREDEGK
jgi:bifunctional DNA-binding transcriptional regulator/antitoxin component of YhaV-PrlF toxin-antitoxin module